MFRKLWPALLVSLVILRPGELRGADPKAGEASAKPRARVIIDNDFGGDPDGLFQLAHHLLSPSVEIRGIVGSHQYPDGFYGYPGGPTHACATARELLAAMNLAGTIPVYPGAEKRIGNDGQAVPSEATRFIVREAMRDDTRLPLVYAAGAGLTDLASACLLQSKVAGRIRLVWIGGHEHDGIAVPPPGGQRMEYNLGIDLKAGQVIFNQTEMPVWQVPRDAYRQALVSFAELRVRMKDGGRLADFLEGRLRELMNRAWGGPVEAYVLGDSPLVLLTALQTSWEADPASSRYVSLPTPTITDQGLYEARPQGRPMRVYTQLDTRLMFEDFYAKVSLFGARNRDAK